MDTDELRPGDPPPAPPLRVLAVGTLHEVKGQRVLIDACARLVAGGTEVEVEIVGDGPDRADLERQATARGLDDRVRFRGALARPDVLDAYRRAHVLAAPSVPTRRGKREGIPVVLMEAMAHGLPVVASRLSGIPELVEPEVNGLLVAPGDAAEVATALGRLAADPALRARLGAAGRATVERRFDLDANAARLLETIAGSGP